MYIKLTNGNPTIYTIGDLRHDNPNVSFPKNISTETLATYDVYPVKVTIAPKIDYKTHRHTNSVEQVSGEWTQVWEVVELPVEKASENIRAYRNTLLSSCDWTQVADAPVDPAAWAVYRQALRDITSQESFPWNVEFPEPPIGQGS